MLGKDQVVLKQNNQSWEEGEMREKKFSTCPCMKLTK